MAIELSQMVRDGMVNVKRELAEGDPIAISDEEQDVKKEPEPDTASAAAGLGVVDLTSSQ